jgi:hypothetical protein
MHETGDGAVALVNNIYQIVALLGSVPMGMLSAATTTGITNFEIVSADPDYGRRVLTWSYIPRTGAQTWMVAQWDCVNGLRVGGGWAERDLNRAEFGGGSDAFFNLEICPLDGAARPCPAATISFDVERIFGTQRITLEMPAYSTVGEEHGFWIKDDMTLMVAGGCTLYAKPTATESAPGAIEAKIPTGDISSVY